MALTLRLEDDELATLERIKHHLGASTASAAIKQLIGNYEATQRSLATLLDLSTRQTREAEELKRHTLNYLEAQSSLARLVGHPYHPEKVTS